MTLIVASATWMAADRRVTADGATSSMRKIAKNPHLIAGASGTAVSTLDVLRAVRKGVTNADDLLEHVDKSSYALVLTPDGRVSKIQDGRVWLCPIGLEAIGTGGDLALGWLACYERFHGGFFGGEHGDVIRQAFTFVAKRRSDCGGGVDFRYFE